MKVLVAIDNKPSSQAILDAVLKMHWHAGTEIHLISVLPAGVDYGTVDAPPEVEEIENLAVELKGALTQCAVTFVARHGEPKHTILAAAEEIKAELIVVGSNSKNTIERLLVGSVSQGIVNEATCPVMIAKTPCSLARETSPAFKNILVPIDHSPFTDAAVRWLGNMNWAQNATFIVCAVVDENTDMEQVETSLKRCADSLSRVIRTNNVVVETAVGPLSESILNLGESHHADLIVMGSHGHKGLQKLILGSTTQAVLHDASCAMMIVRGLVPADRNWYKTGHFDKVAPPENYGNERDSPGDSAHIMPSGM